MVQLKPKSIWEPGVIVEKVGDRRYKMYVNNKGTYIRNIIFLRPSSLKGNNNQNTCNKKQVTWSKNAISERKGGKGDECTISASLDPECFSPL
jgi:hypothetical protein